MDGVDKVDELDTDKHERNLKIQILDFRADHFAVFSGLFWVVLIFGVRHLKKSAIFCNFLTLCLL